VSKVEIDELFFKFNTNIASHRLTHKWPHLPGDVDRLERVQRRATKRLKGFKGIGYKDRLRELGVMTLETRIIGADLIEVIKILRAMAGPVERMGACER